MAERTELQGEKMCRSSKSRSSWKDTMDETDEGNPFWPLQNKFRKNNDFLKGILQSTTPRLKNYRLQPGQL